MDNFIPYIFLIPTLFFLFGKRLRVGISERKKIHDDIHVQDAGKFHPRNLFVVTKMMGYFILLSLNPMPRLGFWHDYPRTGGIVPKPDLRFWLCLILNILFFIWGWMVSTMWIIWFYLADGIFSQLIRLGMFFGERYLLAGNVAFVMLVYLYFQQNNLGYTILYILGTVWAYHSFLYIKAHRDNCTLYAYGMAAHPHTVENFTGLGAWYMNSNEWDRAIYPLMCGLNLAKHGTAWRLHTNLSESYRRVGHYEKALLHLRLAMRNCSKSRMPALLTTEKWLTDKLDKIHYQRKLLRKKGII